MSRTLVVGDIHGGLKALKQVLERANVTDKDKLIFLGDYVDGWSESSQVINALIELSQKQECIFVKGNHDLYCEEWLSFGHKPEMWLLNGGVATMESYADYSDEEIDKHLEFLARCIIIIQMNRTGFLYMPAILLCMDPKKKCIPVITDGTEHCGRPL